MKRTIVNLLALFVSFGALFAQTNPAITSWLQNTTTTGYYYMSGNSTPISHGILVNCQQVRYSTNNVYINATGMPAYFIGPYLDNNPNQAGNQNAIFKIPLNPSENTGVKTPTTGGNIGIFVNGVAMFDYRDGVAWNTSTNSWCGGPGNPTCPGGMGATQSWMRDAVVFEKQGFDCSKGHPAGTNYHHHQNPSAFKLDLNVISTICNLYDADGLYTINPTQHSPLIGFTYDGFPVYGAYGYANANGTGGITRIKSGYQLRNITVRTHHADGTDVPDGPPVNATYPIGTFREDYEWVSHVGDESFLDEHNGRFCVTPEYPNGIYCYFATVDLNHNSAYPYLVGPTYYENKTGAKVTSITETTTTYTPTVNNTITISSSDTTICVNTSVTFSASMSLNVSNPTYQWYKNGTSVGSNAMNYVDNLLQNGDEIYCVVSTTAPSMDTSNSIIISVISSITPSINISTPSTTICGGEATVFTASIANGGSNPFVQWRKNNINVGTNDLMYVDANILNNDMITCELTSSLSCANPMSILSNNIQMTVSDTVIPSISISASSLVAAPGAAVNFSASFGNGGSSPSFQWFVNGVDVGTNSATFSANFLNDGDEIMCGLMSNSSCALAGIVYSNEIVISIDSSLLPIKEENFINNIQVFPNPASDIIAIQIEGLNKQDLSIHLYDIQGKLIKETILFKGQTIAYFDIQTLYSGTYMLVISSNKEIQKKHIVIQKE
jgi:hypothetical protein